MNSLFAISILDLISRASFVIMLSKELKFVHSPANLTFIGPYIVINFYSKTNEMHLFLKFILFCSSNLHVSDGFPSIIRSLRLYTQHQVYVKQILLTAY